MFYIYFDLVGDGENLRGKPFGLEKRNLSDYACVQTIKLYC